MFCRKCNKEIPDDSDFCYKCGTPTRSQPVVSGNSKLWDYNDAVNKMNSAKSLKDFEAVESIFKALGNFKDSAELLKKCHEEKISIIYDNAVTRTAADCFRTACYNGSVNQRYCHTTGNIPQYGKLAFENGKEKHQKFH